MGMLKSDVPQIDKISEMQFNKTGIMLSSLRCQKPFIDLITNPDKPVHAFNVYYNECDSARKSKIDAALNIPTWQFWNHIDLAILWFNAIEYATKLVSSNTFPMSAYLPVVQALHNAFKKVIANKGKESFDSIFTEGAGASLTTFIQACFNMSGATPVNEDGTTSHKVGLIFTKSGHFWLTIQR